MKPTRDDLRMEWFPPFAMGPDSRKITPEEFDRIARAEGYVKLDSMDDVDAVYRQHGWVKIDGIDVELLKDLIEGNHDGWPIEVLRDIARQVLAALDGETVSACNNQYGGWFCAKPEGHQGVHQSCGGTECAALDGEKT